MWLSRISGSARKKIKKFPKSDQEHILKALGILIINPFVSDISKLKGNKNLWRLRVGNYRVFFELFHKEKAIFIYSIKRRTTATY